MKMDLEKINVLLQLAAQASNHRSFVIAGSLSVIGAVLNPPDDMVLSVDIDMYPKLLPSHNDEIAKQFGINSAFEKQHGYYADPILPALLSLSEGWENRLVPITLQNGIVAWFLDVNDAAVSEYIRSAPNDRAWALCGLFNNILNAAVIEERIRQVINALDGEKSRALEHLGDDVAQVNKRLNLKSVSPPKA